MGSDDEEYTVRMHTYIHVCELMSMGVDVSIWMAMHIVDWEFCMPLQHSRATVPSVQRPVSNNYTVWLHTHIHVYVLMSMSVDVRIWMSIHMDFCVYPPTHTTHRHTLRTHHTQHTHRTAHHTTHHSRRTQRAHTPTHHTQYSTTFIILHQKPQGKTSTS